MKCRDGCEGERKTTQIVCGECWARVPQHLKETTSWATTLWMEINASVAIFDWLAADDKRRAE